MKSRLDKLVSLSVTEVIQVHDYVQLLFSDGTVLNIYNDYRCEPSGQDCLAIKGQIILSVQETATSAEITAINEARVIVDLSDEAYSGPEAMQLCVPGKPIVIWN